MQHPSAFLQVIVRRFAGAAQRLNPRPSQSLHPSTPSRGDAGTAPPAFLSAESLFFKLRVFESARLVISQSTVRSPGFIRASHRKHYWRARVSVLAMMLGWFVSASGSEILKIGLTVGGLDRSVAFYEKVLSFRVLSRSTSPAGQESSLLGLENSETRHAELALGEEHIVLTEHPQLPGHPIPVDSRSFDLWFQHIAIVVSDMDKAYEVLRRVQVRPISTSPQTLPLSNPNAGGIKAFYFRDPENHVLELIWFPPGKGDPKWQHPPKNRLFLGIDHTAIVVSDTEQSLPFYTRNFGLHVAGTSENFGAEQEHLNQVFGARLRITALRGESGPGVEFLEYITPPGGRPLYPLGQANDQTFWEVWVQVPNFPKTRKGLLESGAYFVSRSPESSDNAVIVRDPDGHALRVLEGRAQVRGVER